MNRTTYWGLFAALAALFVLPWWWVTHMPAMDLPSHLALATVLKTRWTVADPFAGLFELPNYPSPNMLYYYVVGFLGRLIPLDTANRLVASLVFVGTPLALAYARRANGADPALALVGFALAATFNLIAGFIGFALALPLMLTLGGLARRQIESPTVPRAIALALVAILTFFAHAHVFLFSLGLVGLIGLCGMWRQARLRRLLYTGVPALVSVAVAAPWYLHRLQLMDHAGGMRPHFHTISANLRYLPVHTFDNLRGDVDVLAGGLLVAALVVLGVVGAISRKPSGGERAHLWLRQAYYLAALAGAITYFAMPSSIRFQQVINGRQAMIALLLFAAAVPFDGRWLTGRIVGAVAIIATLGYGLSLASATLETQHETGDLFSLMAHAEGSTVMVGAHMPKSRAVRMDIYRHMASYHASLNGGRPAATFASNKMQPIRTTPRWRLPGHFSPRRLDHYDYVLSGKPLNHPRLRSLGSSGLFRLYAVKGR